MEACNNFTIYQGYNPLIKGNPQGQTGGYYRYKYLRIKELKSPCKLIPAELLIILRDFCRIPESFLLPGVRTAGITKGSI